MSTAGPVAPWRPGLRLVGAALLAGCAVLAVAAAAAVLGAGPTGLTVTASAGAGLLLLAAGAGVTSAGRRWAGRLRPSPDAWAAVVVALAAAVLLGLLVLVLVLGRLPDRRESDLVWPLAGALAAAAGTSPFLLRRAAVRHRAAGRARSPLAVLEGFGDRGARSAGVEELLLQLAEALRRDLALSAAEVWTRAGDGLQRLVAVPHRAVPAQAVDGRRLGQLRRAGVAGEAWIRAWLPELLAGREQRQVRLGVARYGGEVLGLVVVERPREGARFGPADERRLGDVVSRLGLALHNRRLDTALQQTLDDLRRTNGELRASRARLVAAADAERRRIERDIHDGAQQHLVALAVHLGLARDLVADAPQDAAEVLAELSADLKQTIAQLRDLAHGIYPPLLRDSGLAAALRAAAARSPQPVTVRPGVLGRYGADVEAAVYFCCLEALQNSAKHAPGASVTVEVGEVDGSLRFAVQDDGPGFDASAAPLGAGAGQGMQNMTDRLGAVGGTLSWTAAPGVGTRVEGSVPVPASVGAG